MKDVIEMSDFDMGYYDYCEGFPPIVDMTGSKPDIDYMRGYNQAKQETLEQRTK